MEINDVKLRHIIKLITTSCFIKSGTLCTLAITFYLVDQFLFYETRCVIIYVKRESVAIANALQLEAARATSALCRFNYDAMPSLTSLNISVFNHDLEYVLSVTLGSGIIFNKFDFRVRQLIRA